MGSEQLQTVTKQSQTMRLSFEYALWSSFHTISLLHSSIVIINAQSSIPFGITETSTRKSDCCSALSSWRSIDPKLCLGKLPPDPLLHLDFQANINPNSVQRNFMVMMQCFQHLLLGCPAKTGVLIHLGWRLKTVFSLCFVVFILCIHLKLYQKLIPRAL